MISRLRFVSSTALFQAATTPQQVLSPPSQTVLIIVFGSSDQPAVSGNAASDRAEAKTTSVSGVRPRGYRIEHPPVGEPAQIAAGTDQQRECRPRTSRICGPPTI